MRTRKASFDQFHVLSFEGPDAYSRAGGISSRVNGLIGALADAGNDTHLWFVGNAEGPPHETRGQLQLHRWFQWISKYHPHGVYEAEDDKAMDYAASLPPFMMEYALTPLFERGGRAVVLAEEWHTAHVVLHLDWLLRRAGMRDRVAIFWNANNTFGFERIDWPRLDAAATLVTVSRYMRQRMRAERVDPIVIPNGLSPESLTTPDPVAVAKLRSELEHRVL